MNLTRVAAGLLVACMGGFMAALSQSRSYWLFLNPRFSWLTLLAGVVLAVAGLLLAADRGRRVSLPATLALLLFLPLAILAANQDQGSGSVPATLSESPAASPDPGPPVLRFGTTDYTRLNPAELLTLAEKKDGPDGRAFATDGFVLRTPELDEAGQVAVVRLVITCCFADALAAGVRVKVPEPSAFANGDWVRVAGRLAPASAMTGKGPSVPGVIATVLAENAVFAADVVQSVAESEQPYVFEIRSAEPFAY